ncbi:MAG: hypothetical protein LBI49_11270 [Nocardiopsaceae bacterium]|nr:hypothetical protein [Nocardiopsaceae bacterium]
MTDQAGRMLHGAGVGGPPLEPGRLMNVRSSGSDEGPRALLARVHPDVRRMVVTTEDGQSKNVPVFDCEQIPEVRFACLLVPRDVRLREIVGHGEAGQELERFSLGFQQGQWEAMSRYRFGAGQAGPRGSGPPGPRGPGPAGPREPGPAARSRRPAPAGQPDQSAAGSAGQRTGWRAGQAAPEPVGRLARS